MATILFSSLAKVLGDKVSDYQRTKPAEEKPSRAIRVGDFYEGGEL
jgi:hypothetical protein